MTIPQPGDEGELVEGTIATFERGGTPYTAGTLAPGNDRNVPTSDERGGTPYTAGTLAPGDDQTVTTSDARDTGEGAVRERPFKQMHLEDETILGYSIPKALH